MASDLSNIIKEELSNTLEQLLSKSFKVNSVNTASSNNIKSTQTIEVNIKLSFNSTSSILNFYIPTKAATSFEYLMLGGMGDLKEHIDDEITDAINEIISNVCGSICTSANAQGFDDLKSFKSEVLGSSIVEVSSLNLDANSYDFNLSMDDEDVLLIIKFDDTILPFIGEITGKEALAAPISSAPSSFAPTSPVAEVLSSEVSSVASLLSDNSAKNLKLLFDIKLRLSVRLGRKIFLLKDILRWDIGEIIELEQMVNEPLEILVNGIKIGEGEAVIVEGKFGLKIKNIGNDLTRLSQIGIG